MRRNENANGPAAKTHEASQRAEPALVNGASYDPHIGRVLAGQYRVEALLGRGGMGAVYRGYQLSVGRPVAIKLISAGLPDPSQSLQRFRREAEATGRLNHPNTIRLFDFGLTEHGEVYMVMELLEGCDLSARLQHGPLPPSEAFHILRQMLSALSEAHAYGIVHRDLKPGNVFLSYVHGDASFVKVMDFGIAGMDEGRAAQKLTVTGAVLGTPAYMSPEQAQGKAVDARSDLYSCGVVLFEMLTGRTPFDADSLVSMLLAHVTQPPLRLEEAGVSFPGLPQVQALIDSLLAKSPAGRPASAAHVLAAIDALQPETLALQPSAYRHVQRNAEPTPSEPLTPLGWDNRLKPAAAATSKLWLAASALALIVIALGVELFLPVKLAPAPSASARAVKQKQTQTQAQPALRVEPLPVQPMEAASGSAAVSMTARTHTDVDEAEPEDDSFAKHKDTLADVPQADGADGADELDQSDDAPAAHGGKGRSRWRNAAAARRARARNNRHSGAHKQDSEELARAGVYELPEAAADDVLRRAPAFPSIAAAKRAHGSGKISSAAYEAAISSLRARRQRRIAIEQQNLAQGKITAQEYEWRLERIDQEYRGE